MNATMAWFATYYVFMFEYPASLNNFFTYLQKYFRIPDARKLPTSVIMFVNALDCNTENQLTTYCAYRYNLLVLHNIFFLSRYLCRVNCFCELNIIILLDKGKLFTSGPHP